MHKFGWWQKEDNREGAKAIVDVLKFSLAALTAVGVGIAGFFGYSKLTSSPQSTITVEGAAHNVNSGAGTQIVQRDNGTVVVGYTIQQHERALEKRLNELRDSLERATEAEKQLIRQELAEVTRQLSDVEASFAVAQEELRQLRLRLAEFEGQVPTEQLEAAQDALYRGDRSVAKDLFAQLESQLADSVVMASKAAYGLGEIAEAEVRWHDAYAHYKRASELHGDVKHLDGFGRIAWRLAYWDEAYQATVKALELVGAKYGSESPAYANKLGNLGNIREAQGRLAEAEKFHRQAMTIDRGVYGEWHPAYASDLNNLALVLQSQKRYAEAEELLRKSLRISHRTIGAEHPAYAARLNNLANALQEQGQFAAAEQFYRHALTIGRATIGERHPVYAKRLNNLANALQSQGKFAEAGMLYAEAIEIDRATIGENHPDYAIHLGNFAAVLMKLGRAAEAGPLYRQALAIFEATLSADHPHIAQAKGNLARWEADHGGGE